MGCYVLVYTGMIGSNPNMNTWETINLFKGIFMKKTFALIVTMFIVIAFVACSSKAAVADTATNAKAVSSVAKTASK